MWLALVPIIAQYGLQFAFKLWEKIDAAKDPTAADWAELKALASKTPEDHLRDACLRAGIAWDSPQALELRSYLL